MIIIIIIMIMIIKKKRSASTEKLDVLILNKGVEHCLFFLFFKKKIVIKITD